jgi:CRISPR/Cas system-associated exonuclease Cas4 (RecB family)
MAITAREKKPQANEIEPGKYRLDLKAAHQRYRLKDGTIVPGVTTVLGILDKPALLNWAWRCGQDGIDIHKVKTSAADVGTVCHARCEAWLRGLEFDSYNVSPEQMALSTIGFDRFRQWWDAEELKLHSCELQMVSEELRVGGTADAVAIRPNGNTVLIDIKTSNGIYLEHRIQVATYAYLWAETRLGIEPTEALIVRLGKKESEEIEIAPVKKRRELVEVFRHLAGAYYALREAR